MTNGTWIFSVDHFTVYGVEDEDMYHEDDI